MTRKVMIMNVEGWRKEDDHDLRTDEWTARRMQEMYVNHKMKAIEENGRRRHIGSTPNTLIEMHE